MGKDEQAEELEALRSIYEGDPSFAVVEEDDGGGSTAVELKLGEPESRERLVVQLRWGPEYPDQAPEISLDGFANRHLPASAKEAVRSALAEECVQLEGMAMTFSLLQFLQDAHPAIIQPFLAQAPSLAPEAAEDSREEKTKEEKKDKLTKAQKRRLWDKGGEVRERGWNWVCIIRHLSQAPPPLSSSIAS